MPLWQGLIYRKHFIKAKNEYIRYSFFLVEEGGFEPPKALPTDLQSVPFGHSGTLPYLIVGDNDFSLSPMELVNGLEPLTC